MKKYEILTNLIITIVILTYGEIAFGFGNKLTHPALTNNITEGAAVDSYLKNQLDVSDGIHTQLKYQPEWYQMYIEYRLFRGGYSAGGNNRTILEWFKSGSVIEDEDLDTHPFFVPSIRPRHHFHDPINNVGLDNKYDHPNYSKLFAWATHFYPAEFDVTGQSAKTWAIKGYAQQGPTDNIQCWDDARENFYSALTDSNSLWREYWLSATFLDLGSVLHLIEDMGVPAHTRNDFLFGHYQPPFGFGNDFENWVERIVKQNGGQLPWSGSGPIAFDKLTKYFDANQYTGDYLNDGVLPPNTWGLSECSNYQFLSLSTMFGCSGEKYQFPNPAKEHLGTDIIVPIADGNKIYFNGSNYGVTHIARKSYTYYIATETWGYNAPVIDSTNTTDDEQVFVDYANITVPRTIDYATGLLNYFFRGKLDIEPNCLDCSTVTFYIRNDSNNSGIPQTLKGGTFELFWDDRDGNRTKVNDFTIPGWTSTSELAYENQVTGTFSRPDSNEIETYTVVYKGQISENPDEPDDDDDEAIAAATLKMGYPIVAWGDDTDGIVSNIPEGNDFVDVAAGKYHALAIRSSGSLAAWGWNAYGQCNVPQGNNFIAIAGGVRHSIALKSDGSIVGWGSNSTGQIDVPEGNDFAAVACGDYHGLAITKDGDIVGWGQNYYGESDACQPDEGTIFISVSAGRYHTLALQSDGTIKAWGSNSMGQTRIYLGAGDDHEAVAAADTYNFLLLEDDMLVSWGGGDFVEPGRPDYHYRQPDENDFVAIAAGSLHILALTADGRILLWGYNDYDLPPAPISPVPEGIVFTKDLAAGWKFSVALKAR